MTEKKEEILEKDERDICWLVLLISIASQNPPCPQSYSKKICIRKPASITKGVTQISRPQSTVLVEVEKLLFVWINRKQMVGYILSKPMIVKATDGHASHKGYSIKSKVFHASKG